MLIVREIPTNCVADLEEIITPYVEDGLQDTDTVTTEQALNFLKTGEWNLLLVEDQTGKTIGVYLLTFSNETMGRICMIACAAGKGLASQEAFDQVCDYARQNGASRVMALAKKSAARLYERVGFKEKTSIMEKKLWAA